MSESLTSVTIPKHPAKFSDSILSVLSVVLEAESISLRRSILAFDPMAGVGRVHELASDNVQTWGNELEGEWADAHERTGQGDATNLMWVDNRFDVVLTSPAYGNRMADHHNAKDDSRRMTYKHQLGRDLSENSGAALQWGGEYRELHERILKEMIRVTIPGGLVIVNISNHIRKGVEEPVAEWWLAKMLMLGLEYDKIIPVETPRMRFGENHELRVNNEWVFVTRKGFHV